ncbi:hypothetical protein GDO81_015572 [Engystomops pustulosus]|uniref:Uncharacterized protein n=1 Tax=Engystomops pustulosus TaxID=76066 RepID=A0AAV7AMP4_ENGPU|nr:hypothetical protein GDO81_015572 [Engystomops pustulosus]
MLRVHSSLWLLWRSIDHEKNPQLIITRLHMDTLLESTSSMEPLMPEDSQLTLLIMFTVHDRTAQFLQGLPFGVFQLSWLSLLGVAGRRPGQGF